MYHALGPDELDSETGRVSWPVALLDDQFANVRTDLDDLFALHAWTSRSAGTIGRIRDDLRRMKDILRSNIEIVPVNDYIGARKFIDAVDYSVVTHRRSAEPPAPGVANR